MLKRTAFCLIASSFLFVGCSTTKSIRNPDFYPNAKLQEVGPSQAHQDTRYCMSLADEYVKESNHYKEVAKSTAGGSILGSATGAVGGVIMGNTGRGVGVGAATGAILGLYQGMRDAGQPDPGYEKFVEECLADKGYRVYGWS